MAQIKEECDEDLNQSGLQSKIFSPHKSFKSDHLEGGELSDKCLISETIYLKSKILFKFRATTTQKGIPKGQYQIPFTIQLPEIQDDLIQSFALDFYSVKWQICFGFQNNFDDCYYIGINLVQEQLQPNPRPASNSKDLKKAYETLMKQCQTKIIVDCSTK